MKSYTKVAETYTYTMKYEQELDAKDWEQTKELKLILRTWLMSRNLESKQISKVEAANIINDLY